MNFDFCSRHCCVHNNAYLWVYKTWFDVIRVFCSFVRFDVLKMNEKVASITAAVVTVTHLPSSIAQSFVDVLSNNGRKNSKSTYWMGQKRNWSALNHIILILLKHTWHVHAHNEYHCGAAYEKRNDNNGRWREKMMRNPMNGCHRQQKKWNSMRPILYLFSECNRQLPLQ